MSYPWWLFKLTVKNEHTMETKDVEWQATGLDPEDAMQSLMDDWCNGISDSTEYTMNGWMLVGIFFLHCLTFGVEPESDGILSGLHREAVNDFLGYESQGGYGE